MKLILHSFLCSTHLCFLMAMMDFMKIFILVNYSEEWVAIKKHKVSLKKFISLRLQERFHEFGNILYTKRLLQQFVVDMYTMIEANMLAYICHNQNKIRADYLNGIAKAIDKGEIDPSSVGKCIILPPYFTGGRRYMFNNCQGAMSICKKFGYPDLFITLTCNSAWGEIQRFVRPRNLKDEDRPETCVRVFKNKLDSLRYDLRKGAIFCATNACNVFYLKFFFIYFRL